MIAHRVFILILTFARLTRASLFPPFAYEPRQPLAFDLPFAFHFTNATEAKVHFTNAKGAKVHFFILSLLVHLIELCARQNRGKQL
jgi:hypothetical protein